ncbi:MAG: AAA family ATPase, partial [Mycobacteriaceae bacterium]|nr:AAA family ATPase [Mycobacteriaceae bacterium]
MANLPADGVFVGREGELSALLDARHDPRVRAVLIAGEPGIGKSRLTAEFAARQTPTTEVLVGRCPESGSDVAFAPFLGVLRDLPGTDRTQLFGAVLTRLEQRAAAHPVVLVLEDLHWADSSSLELFAFLIANLAEPDVLLLGTYRPVCPPGLRRLVAELRRNPTVRHVEPGSFTRHQVGRQLAALLGREPEPRRVTEVLEHSSGNPLFVAALSAAPGLSVDLDALLLAALTDSSDDAGALARTAAVIGSPIDHALLEAAAGLPAAQLHAGLRELVQRQVLTALDSGGTTDIGYEFRHVLLRQAIYADLLAAERIGTHARLAQLISARPELVAAPRREAARAHHAYAAGDLPLALESAWAAAQQAHRIGAHPERLRHLDRVLQLWDRVPDAAHRIAADRLAVLEHVVDAAFHGADTQRGIDAATEALDLLTGATDHHPHTRITQVHPQLRVHLSDSGVA